MTDARYRGPERREYMRSNADCAVDYLRLSDKLKPSSGRSSGGYTKDISASGLSFISEAKVPAGSFIELHIKIPGAEKFITAIGKIMRCECLESGKYGLAVSFIWLNTNDKKLIDEFVRNKKLEDLRSEMKE